MPAVTADTLTLPRLTALAEATGRPVTSVTTAPTGFEGEGFPVHRAFAGVPIEDLDPFIHMDQMGEVEYAPGEPKGTPWHPHRGFETFTYLIDGQFLHQDSNGGGGTIDDGGTQYMTAGDGILHIETPPAHLVESGGLFHGVQLWINLPRGEEAHRPAVPGPAGPATSAMLSSDRTAVPSCGSSPARSTATPGRASRTRRWPSRTSPSPPGAQVEIPWRRGLQRAGLRPVRLRHGRRRASSDPRRARLAVLGDGDIRGRCRPTPRRSRARRTSRSSSSAACRCASRWLAYGPFVMSTKAEIIEAFEDFQAGRLGTVPAEAIQPHRV